MSSVGSSNTGGVTGNSEVSFKPVEFFDESVKQGYDRRDTESRNTAIAEAKQQSNHRLDQPRVAHSANVQGTTAFSSMSMPDFNSLIPKNIEGFDFKNFVPQMGGIQDSANLMQGIQQLEGVLGDKLDPGKLGDMMKIMFSPDSNMSTDEAWKWAETKLDPAEFKMLEQSMGREGKFGFADATVKLNALISGPSELVKEIKSDYQKMARMMMSDKLWDTDMISTMLSSIQQKMQDNRLKFDQENIKIGQVEKERLSNKIISDIKERIEKINKSKESSWIGKIFGYIGLAVMAVVTVLAFATGVGAVAGALMVVALAMMIAMTVDQETGGHGMKAITKGVMDAFGVDEQTATYITSGVLMGIMIALSLGAGAGGAAAGGASRLAVLGSKAGMVASGGAAVGEGSAKIASGVYSYEASMLQAETKETKAKMMRLQQMIEDATESLQMALEDLQAGHARIAAIISNNDDTKKGIMRNFK